MIDIHGLEFKDYRKKPVVIQAAQIFEAFEIPTKEGLMHGSPGDYLIIGVEGEMYPCKPTIFEKTYEAVDEPLPLPDV